MTVRIDGVRIQVHAADVDGDGITGGIERVNQQLGDDSRELVQPTDMGEVIGNLKEDKLDESTGMSSVDFISNLHPLEVPSLIGIDTLVGFSILPRQCLNLTRQVKRLRVSQGARGREDIVRCVTGERDHQQASAMGGGGVIDRIKGFFNKEDKEKNGSA